VNINFKINRNSMSLLDNYVTFYTVLIIYLHQQEVGIFLVLPPILLINVL